MKTFVLHLESLQNGYVRLYTKNRADALVLASVLIDTIEYEDVWTLIEEFKCVECLNKLTEYDIKEWENESDYCCEGYKCGCLGKPLDPPLCSDCRTRFHVAFNKQREMLLGAKKV